MCSAGLPAVLFSSVCAAPVRLSTGRMLNLPLTTGVTPALCKGLDFHDPTQGKCQLRSTGKKKDARRCQQRNLSSVSEHPSTLELHSGICAGVILHSELLGLGRGTGGKGESCWCHSTAVSPPCTPQQELLVPGKDFISRSRAAKPQW